MQTTDSIADMLTRIRNASSAKHDSVKIPASNMKKAIAQILVDEGKTLAQWLQIYDAGALGSANGALVVTVVHRWQGGGGVKPGGARRVVDNHVTGARVDLAQ